MWDSPGSGADPISPALADRLSSTELPREPCNYLSFEFLLELVGELGKPGMKL